MTIREAITLFGYHQRSDLKARTVQSYHPLLQRFEARFADRPFDSIGSDEIYHFLESLTEKLSKSTPRLRYAQLKAFCNFLIEECNLNMRNLFRVGAGEVYVIAEEEPPKDGFFCLKPTFLTLKSSF